MARMPDIFNTNTSDLGDNTIGIDRLGVDTAFTNVSSYSAPKCIVCSNPPKFRLVPKIDRVNTAEIQDKGYICEHCVSLKHFSTKEFGIRELR